MINTTQAIVRIGHERQTASANLKRMALFFDRILFVLPDYWLVKDDVINDPRRATKLEDGNVQIHSGLDPFIDTVALAKIPIGQLGAGLDHDLDYLVRSGVAEEYEPAAVARDMPAFDQLRSEVGWLDVEVERFRELSGTLTAGRTIESTDCVGPRTRASLDRAFRGNERLFRFDNNASCGSAHWFCARFVRF